MKTRCLLLASLFLGCATTRPPATAAAVTVETIRGEARDASAWVKSPLAKAFLATAVELPKIEPRTVYLNPDKTRGYTQAQADLLPPAEKAALIRKDLDEEYYYTTKYGTPVSYARPLDILAAHGLTALKGLKVVDFGYGYIGHLRMFALLGADATGIEVDPLLPALYSQPGDTGTIGAGTVRLVDGRFPSDPAVKDAVGQGYDLFLSKNVLKIGYVHPSQPVDPKRTLQLNVDDDAFVNAIWNLLKPGGRALLYNLYPAQNPPGKEWIAWAEGLTPFTRATWEKAGFQVVAFDLDDTAQIRELAHVLAWDKGEDPMDLKTLFAVYTLVEKP